MQGFVGSLRGQVDGEGLVDGWVTVVSGLWGRHRLRYGFARSPSRRNDFGTLKR